MEFEKIVYRTIIVFLLIVLFLSAVCFFEPFLAGGYEGVIENDGMVLVSMYGISLLGFVILYKKK